MGTPVLGDQQTHSSALCGHWIPSNQEQWSIGTVSERESKDSVLSAHLDYDDDANE